MATDWKKIGQTALAGTLSGVDELLFGLPEYIAKKVDRKAVEKYIKDNQSAHDIGGAGGMIASAFIPYAGLAGKALKGAGLAGKGIGAAAKAAKGVDTAMDVAKIAGAADTGADALKGADKLKGLAEGLSKYSKLAGKGAISGGAEAAVRGVTGEKTPEQIIKDIQTGATFGGAGGVLGGVLAKKAPRLMDAAQEATAKQYNISRGLNTKAMKQGYLKSIPKGAGASYKAQNVGDYLRDVTEFGKTIPRGEGYVEELSKSTTDTLETLSKAFESKFKNVPAKTIIKKIISPEDMAHLSELYGDDVAKEAVNYVLSQSGNKTGAIGMKKFFQGLGDSARTNPKISENVNLAQAIQDIAYGMKGKIDDISFAALPEGGIGGKTVAEIRQAYKLAKPFENAEFMDTLSLAKPGGGSGTFEKLGTAASMAALGGATGMAGEGTFKERLEKAGKNAIFTGLAGLGGQALVKGSSGLASRAIGSLDTAVNKIAKSMPKITSEAATNYAAKAGGQLASMAAREATKQAQPQTPQEAEAVDMAAAAGSGNKQAYMEQVFSKLDEFAAAQGVQKGTPEYDTFIKEAAQLTNGFNPEAMAGLFYQDPAEREAYTKAYRVSKALTETLPRATMSKPGFLASEAQESQIQRNSAIDQLSSLVGDVGKEKGSEKEAKAALTKILNSKADEGRKMELVKTLLSAYGVDFGTLERIGLA